MDTRTLCLAVLSRRDASGYDVKKACEEGPFSHFHQTSYGAIYPALNRLAEEGLVSCTALAQDKRPDKKLYSITAAGREAFRRALMVPPAGDYIRSDFLFISFFADLLPPDHMAQLIDDRIAHHEACLAHMSTKDCSCGTAGERFTHGVGVAYNSALLEYFRANRDALIAELERTAAARVADRSKEKTTEEPTRASQGAMATGHTA